MGQVVKTFAYIEQSLDCDRLRGLLIFRGIRVIYLLHNSAKNWTEVGVKNLQNKLKATKVCQSVRVGAEKFVPCK